MIHCVPPFIHLLLGHIGVFFYLKMWKHEALSLLNGGDKPEEDSDNDTEDDN